MELNISRNDLVLAFSEALDLLDPKLYHHHLTVAYIAYSITEYLSISAVDLNDLMLAALLHDIGMFKNAERRHLENYDDDATQKHTRIGYLLIHQYPSFEHIAQIVLHHHTPYNKAALQHPLLSHLLYLADRISVWLDYAKPLILQQNDCVDAIAKERGVRFMPILCDAFIKLSRIEAFWISMEYRNMRETVKTALKRDYRITTIEELFHIGRLFITAIDYRSRYTAAHSIGVSKVSRLIAQYAGISDFDQSIIEVSGYFHDIGKVAIDKEILDKPAKLTNEEFSIIKTHAYYTFEILKHVNGFETIAQIAAFHHERLDGTGYPFHLTDPYLIDYARLVAVADLFTALTEKRPYRKSLNKSEIIEILVEMVVAGQIDNRYVDLAIRNFDELYEENASFQKLAYNDFDLFEENMQIDHYLFLKKIR